MGRNKDDTRIISRPQPALRGVEQQTHIFTGILHCNDEKGVGTCVFRGVAFRFLIS